jgi:hypothetical protein
MDKETHRFYVYHGSKLSLPFSPYGWMPGEASSMLSADMECKTQPYVDRSIPGLKPSPACVRVSVNWQPPLWAGIAWISGPDKPPWWCDSDKGWFYNLSALRKKRLVTHLRSPDGARVQIKVGIMGDKPYPESTRFPIESQWLTLGPKWKEVVIDLSEVPSSSLKRIASGFVVIMSQVQQPDPNTPATVFYIGDTWYE